MKAAAAPCGSLPCAWVVRNEARTTTASSDSLRSIGHLPHRARGRRRGTADCDCLADIIAMRSGRATDGHRQRVPALPAAVGLDGEAAGPGAGVRILAAPGGGGAVRGRRRL